MIKTIRKFFFVWQFEEEEKWLNQMAAQGLALRSVGFCRYDFETCERGEYSIRLELLKEFPDNPESVEYIRFIESTGAEQVGSYLRWCYFRRKVELGQFDLFSDLESRISHVERVLAFVRPICAAELLIAFSNFGIGISSGFSVNIVCASIVLALALMLGYAAYRLEVCRKKLKAERELFE